MTVVGPTMTGIAEDKMVEMNRKGMSLLDEILERRMLLYVFAAGATIAALRQRKPRSSSRLATWS